MSAMPDDFAEMAMKLPLTGLMRHYERGETTIKRWLHCLPSDVFCARAALMKQRKSESGKLQRRNKPSGFDAMAATATMDVLAEHFGASHWCVRRWIDEMPYIEQLKRRHALKAVRKVAVAPQTTPTAKPVDDAASRSARLADLIEQAAAERAAQPVSDRYAGLSGFDLQLAKARDNGVTVIPTLTPALPDRSLTGSQMALLS